MDRLRIVAKVLLGVLCTTQVCGAPLFWSQADCYQGNVDNSFNGYESYQGPSYQETLQAMVEETLRALCDIVRVTARATKQELAELAKIFYQGLASNSCSSDTDDSPGEYQFSESPQQPVNSPDNGYPSYGGHQNDVPAEFEISLTTTEKTFSSVQETSSLENKIGQNISETSSSTNQNLTSSINPMLLSKNNSNTETHEPTTDKTNNYYNTISHGDRGVSQEESSSAAFSSDETTAMSASTTDGTTGISFTNLYPTSAAFDSTTTEVTEKPSRKSKL